MEQKFAEAIKEAEAAGFAHAHTSCTPDGDTDLVSFNRGENDHALFDNEGWTHTLTMEIKYDGSDDGPDGSISLEVSGNGQTLQAAIDSAKRIVSDAASRIG